jgi:hypothetical protein
MLRERVCSGDTPLAVEFALGSPAGEAVTVDTATGCP